MKTHQTSPYYPHLSSTDLGYQLQESPRPSQTLRKYDEHALAHQPSSETDSTQFKTRPRVNQAGSLSGEISYSKVAKYTVSSGLLLATVLASLPDIAGAAVLPATAMAAYIAQQYAKDMPISISGTSFSAPHVTGGLAWVLSAIKNRPELKGLNTIDMRCIIRRGNTKSDPPRFNLTKTIEEALAYAEKGPCTPGLPPTIGMPFKPTDNTINAINKGEKTNDPYRIDQWGLDQNGIGMDQAHNFVKKQGLTEPDLSITAAVIDALPARELLEHTDMPPLFVKYFSKPYGLEWPNTYTEHGLQAASIISALENNRQGISGIANINIQYAGIKLPTDGVSITNAMEWLGGLNAKNKNPVDIINISLSPLKNPVTCGTVPQKLFRDLSERGIIVVVASGNNGSQIFNNCSEHAIVVGSTDPDGHLSKFSNFGPRVDTYAPGQDILVYQPQLPEQSGLSAKAIAKIVTRLVAGCSAAVVGGIYCANALPSHASRAARHRPLRIEARPTQSAQV